MEASEWIKIKGLVERCESPIERQFLAAWMELITEGWSCNTFDIHTPLSAFMELPERVPWSLLHAHQSDFIFIQQPIGKYRLDFLIGRYCLIHEFPNGSNRRSYLWRAPLIAVECDGHDFHERTKEQAQRDKSRDRTLLAKGIRTMRFTGSEVYRDACRCAYEVNGLFGALLVEEQQKH